MSVTITRIVVVLVAVAVLVGAGPSLLARGSDLRDDVGELVERDGGDGQSAQQISSAEFAGVHGGTLAKRLRSLAGAPDERTTVRVEGLEVECWYYGVVGATGTYQFCFVDGRLSSKRRFAAARASD
ncbi:MAG: hypothetical protein ABR583_12730 [Gaiellaceae bacterium]